MNNEITELEFLVLKEIRKFFLEYGNHFDNDNEYTLACTMKSNLEKLYNLMRLSSGLKPIHDIQKVVYQYKEWIEWKDYQENFQDFDGGSSGYGAEFDRDNSDQGDSVKDLVDYLGYDGSTEGLSADDIWERTGH